MALKDFLKYGSRVGLASSAIGAGAVVGGMLLNPAFSAYVLGLTIAGVSLGGLGLPLVASTAIAASVAAAGSFGLGVSALAAASAGWSLLSSGFSFVKGLFANNKNPLSDSESSKSSESSESSESSDINEYAFRSNSLSKLGNASDSDKSEDQKNNVESSSTANEILESKESTQVLEAEQKVEDNSFTSFSSSDTPCDDQNRPDTLIENRKTSFSM